MAFLSELWRHRPNDAAPDSRVFTYMPVLRATVTNRDFSAAETIAFLRQYLSVSDHHFLTILELQVALHGANAPLACAPTITAMLTPMRVVSQDRSQVQIRFSLNPSTPESVRIPWVRTSLLQLSEFTQLRGEIMVASDTALPDLIRATTRALGGASDVRWSAELLRYLGAPPTDNSLGLRVLRQCAAMGR